MARQGCHATAASEAVRLITPGRGRAVRRNPQGKLGPESRGLSLALSRVGGMPEILSFPTPPTRPIAAEFFAGIGLARMGLEAAGFHVTWANDIERDKHDMYVRHFKDPANSHTFALGDVANVHGEDLPKGLSLAWASFPCTDLSLAGWRRGLIGKQSSTFWPFTEVLEELRAEKPPVVALENVIGLATSHGGKDLAAAIERLNDLGYSVDVLTLDARRFVPQSRPRLFLVGALTPPSEQDELPNELRPEWLSRVFADSSLRTHRALLKKNPPQLLVTGLSELVEDLPSDDVRWWDELRRNRFLNSLSPLQAERLRQMQRSPRASYRTAYRRTRNGVAMWEIRPDDISGCLRTAKGGSSKQAVVRAGDGRVEVRWMTPREYAFLMGADSYDLEGVRTNQALYGFGDAVCVPAIAWLAEHYLMPLVEDALRPALPLAARLVRA